MLDLLFGVFQDIMKVCTIKYYEMYYVKFKIWVTGKLCYSLEYNVDALNFKWKVISFKQGNKNEKKEERFGKSFGKS